MQGVHCDLVPSCGSSSMDSWLAGIAMQFKHEARYSKDARKNCPPCTISAPPASAQLHRRGQRTAAHRAKHPDDGLHERRLRWLRPREEPLVQPRPDHGPHEPHSDRVQPFVRCDQLALASVGAAQPLLDDHGLQRRRAGLVQRVLDEQMRDRVWQRRRQLGQLREE